MRSTICDAGCRMHAGHEKIVNFLLIDFVIDHQDMISTVYGIVNIF